MPISLLQTLDIIEAMEGFIDKKRPPEHIRHQVDLSYNIEDQSIFIVEIRPNWKNPELKIECPIAKTTFVKAKNQWKVFWMRGNGNWVPYTPQATIESLSEFLNLVVEDKHHCFWG